MESPEDPASGEPVEVPNADIDFNIQVLARWATEQQSKKENTPIEYVKVLGATVQLVAGTLYKIILEARSNIGGYSRNYEATIWGKGWENFIELVEFKPLPEDAHAN